MVYHKEKNYLSNGYSSCADTGSLFFTKMTPQYQLNLANIRKLRAMLNNEKNLVRTAFYQLKPNQRRFLLIASGLPEYLLERDKLTDQDIKSLRAGIQRLKCIVNTFSHCKQSDFENASNHQLQNIGSAKIISGKVIKEKPENPINMPGNGLISCQ